MTEATHRPDDGLMPVNRDYDFSTKVPDTDEVPEYFESDGELTRVKAAVAGRHRRKNPTVIILYGPSGCGKSTLAETIAQELQVPKFEIQGKYSLYEENLLGSPSIAASGESVWADGPLTQALLASQNGPVVIFFDEANRARPEAKGAFFSALDYRARVTLDGPRGGEVIQGVPENIIVIATANRGREYSGTQKFDFAEKGRYSRAFEVDYVGMTDPGKEVSILTGRTGVSESWAKKVVSAANDIRTAANNDDKIIDVGVPTRALIECALAALDYRDAAQLENTAFDGSVNAMAVKDTIVTPYYSENEAIGKAVTTTFRDTMADIPVTDEDMTGYVDYGNSGEKLVCKEKDCDWEAPKEDAPDKAVYFFECPTCDNVSVAVKRAV